MGTKNRTNLDFKSVNIMLNKKKCQIDAILFPIFSSPKKKQKVNKYCLLRKPNFK